MIYKNILCEDKPLKNEGFHIKRGAIPHFVKIQINMINHAHPTDKTELVELEVSKKLKIYSSKYQSNVKVVKYTKIKNKNRFREVIREIQ